MKNYILFFFLAFQLCTYAQHSTHSNINFEKELTSLDIASNNSEEKTQLIDSSCYSNSFNFSNDSDDFVLNQADNSKIPLKSLNVSKRIKLDYLVFSYNQLTVADLD